MGVAILAPYLISFINSKRSKTGMFVYVDCFNMIHTNRDCAANLADDTPKNKDERIAEHKERIEELKGKRNELDKVVHIRRGCKPCCVCLHLGSQCDMGVCRQ